MKTRALVFAAMLLAAPAWGRTATVAWDDLTDQDVSPEARAALGTPEGWRHAESAHFVFHFRDEKGAETILLHSEETYDWIKRLFGVSDDRWRKKAHVFVFDDKAEWERLLVRLGRERLSTAFTNGHELFMYREPYWLAPQHTLAHELTHVIAFRFLDGPIPLFLNEGLAEYVATKTAARQTGGDHYAVRSLAPIAEEDYVPLFELSAMRGYPAGDERVLAFYRESERFVRYLVHERKGDFYAFLKDVSSGTVWHRAAERHYGAGAPELEDGFRRYAVSGE